MSSLWSSLVGALDATCDYASHHSTRLISDPSTPAYIVWVLTLEWWQQTAGVLAIVAMMIGTKRVLRWPFLSLVLLFLFLELVTYFSVRYIVYLLERFIFITNSQAKIKPLRQQMESASSYEEWCSAAERADELLGSSTWKEQPQSRYYNHRLLVNLMRELRASREAADVPRLTATLQTCLHKNTAGIMNENLYSKTLVGSKLIISEYIDELMLALRFLEDRACGGRESTTSNGGLAAAQRPAQIEQQVNGVSSSRQSGSVHTRERRGRSSTRGDSTAASPARRSRSTSRRSGRSSAIGKKKKQLTGGCSSASAAAQVHPHDSSLCVTDALDAGYKAPQVLASSDVSSPREMLSFFQAAKRQFGATALCLSGGASIGNYHWGVIKALLDDDMLPRIISGTSSGAVVAALTCTRTDAELHEVLNPHTLAPQLTSFEESVWVTSTRFIRTKAMYDSDKWMAKLQYFAHSDAIPNMTFLEAHQRTGRVLNITCTSQRKHNPSMLLNYLTTPHVCIASAILASAAVPGFITPVVLQEKIEGVIRPYHEKDLQWCDGSLQRDLPLSELAEQFGANFFLVVQCNPHVIPWFFNSRGQSGTPSSWRRRTGGYRGGFMLSALELFLKEDMKKNMRVLNELELLPNILGSDFSFLFLQDFQGTVTLVPNASVRDFVKIISDPTVPDMERFIREGRLTAWRKFSMIRNRMVIANELNLAIARMSRALHGEPDVANLEQQYDSHLPGVHPVHHNRKVLQQHDRGQY